MLQSITQSTELYLKTNKFYVSDAQAWLEDTPTDWRQTGESNLESKDVSVHKPDTLRQSEGATHFPAPSSDHRRAVAYKSTRNTDTEVQKEE